MANTLNAHSIVLLRLPWILRKVLVNTLNQWSFFHKLRSRLLQYWGGSLTHGPAQDLPYAIETLEFYASALARVDQSCTSKIALEIGTGDNLAVPLGWIALGGERVVTVDPGDYLLPAAQLAPLYRQVAAHFGQPEPGPEAWQRIEHYHHPVENLPTAWDGRFDVVFSYNVMEHIAEVDKAFANIARVLKPGGLTIHWIDTSSHNHIVKETDPLEFLIYPEWLWRYLSPPGRGRLNRIRYSQVVAAVEKSGLEIMSLNEEVGLTPEHVACIRERLAPPFNQMPDHDLTPLRLSLIARRPVAPTL